MLLGTGSDGNDVYVPFKDVLPMVDPNEIIFDGEYIISSRSVQTIVQNSSTLSVEDQATACTSSQVHVIS